MIFASIALSAIGAIVVSEIVGRGKVVYTRMLSLVVSYVVCCSVAGYLALRRGGSEADVVAIALSVVPIMAAWLGFRIHVSSSITLEMASLLEDGRARSLRQMAVDYDVDGHTTTRVAILQDGGYLTPDAEARVTDSAKSRAILLLIRVMCGPEGPRAVAESLRRRDAGSRSTNVSA